ncbi:DUF2971 domain-containing protein [Methylobacterium sp. SD21]|uniref:DUF2971 domain-containing protein n=1 Tax=Methylobacterium litchii TaxID=3138810 RepID=UPI00313EA44B
MSQLEQMYASLYPAEGAQRAAAKNKRFVHYTTADVARSIIEKKQVWMRSTRVMNDFREIEHGIECLNNGLNSPEGKALHDLIYSINGVGLTPFHNEAYIGLYKNSTYITSISEHDSSEDNTGRLSMWRAYGGTTGVAMVVNNKPFIEPNDNLGAWTFPVTYCGTDGYISKFAHMHTVISGDIAYYQAQKSWILDRFYDFLLFLVLCTKHPGFAEEREWRVVYNSVHTAEYIKQSIQSVRGTPQIVYLLPLENIPAINFYGAHLPEFLSHLIIGPTLHPEVMQKAFVKLLGDNGVPHPDLNVRISDIPLRHYS